MLALHRLLQTSPLSDLAALSRLSLPVLRLHWVAGIGIALAVLATTQPSHATDGTVIPLSATDRQQIEKILGTKVIGGALPAQPLLPATGYLPKTAGNLTYTVIRNGKKAENEIHAVSKADPQKDGGDLQYEIKSVERMVLADADQGGKTVAREYDFDKQVVSTFTPGQPLIIAGLAPGESRVTQIHVAVADIDKPTKTDYRGELEVTYTNLGRFRVHVPAGDYDADLIKWTYSGDIGPASVETAQYRFLAADAGMVAMVEWRSISAILIYHERSRIGKLLGSSN